MYKIECYSKSSEGSVKVSPHFKASEFACSDGSDSIFISTELVKVLESIRNKFAAPVTINSGWRSPSYNKKIGGAAKSQHMYGTAADIKVKGVLPATVAAYAETLLPRSGGIGIYQSFTHIDVRSIKSRWKG